MLVDCRVTLKWGKAFLTEYYVFQQSAQPWLFHLFLERVRLLYFNGFAVYMRSFAVHIWPIQFQAQRVLRGVWAAHVSCRAAVRLHGCVILRGDDAIFCAGADLQETLHRTETTASAYDALIEALIAFDKPLVAAVLGPCVGLGVALLSYCDLVYCGEKALFSIPFLKINLQNCRFDFYDFHKYNML